MNIHSDLKAQKAEDNMAKTFAKISLIYNLSFVLFKKYTFFFFNYTALSNY